MLLSLIFSPFLPSRNLMPVVAYQRPMTVLSNSYLNIKGLLRAYIVRKLFKTLKKIFTFVEE